jgi:cellulose synthase/poly-beta-1,6-N-acetylglucosamine synthase-like glycosyltransferase
MKKIKIMCLMMMLLLSAIPVFAEEDGGDWVLFGFEGEKLFNLGSGILSTILFVLTFIAYKRTKQSRLLYVSSAFLLFAVKGYLGASELFFEELLWIDPTAAVLNFAILLCFFFGIMKK